MSKGFDVRAFMSGPVPCGSFAALSLGLMIGAGYPVNTRAHLLMQLLWS
jgi:hypothetical protein